MTPWSHFYYRWANKVHILYPYSPQNRADWVGPGSTWLGDRVVFRPSWHWIRCCLRVEYYGNTGRRKNEYGKYGKYRRYLLPGFTWKLIRTIITSTCFIITCSYVNYNIGIFTYDSTNAIYMHKWLIYGWICYFYHLRLSDCHSNACM